MEKILYNGNFYLGRNRFAEAVLIRGERIEAVGRYDDLRRLSPDAERTDLGGRTVIPGFNDSHMHALNFGNKLRAVNLTGAASIGEVIGRGQDFIRDTGHPAGETLFGRGWNQDYFTDGGAMPTRHDLDRIADDRPILYLRACGHVTVCNTFALKALGIGAGTPQPEGGQFDLEPDGMPNGIFRELAMGMVNVLLPKPTPEDYAKSIKMALDYAAAFGITSLQSNDVHDENFPAVLGAFRLLEDRGEMTARVYEQNCFYDPRCFADFLAGGHRTGDGNHLFKIGPLKLLVDGSLGARTALMRQDYADMPGTRGIECVSRDLLAKLIRMGQDAGMQIAVHCIGDAAVERLCDLLEPMTQSGNPLRHGIVHCQITDRGLLRRIKEQNLLVYAQPIFLHYDLHIVESRCGKGLAETSYAFGSMMRDGVHVSYGTDAPVEDLNPFDNLHCAVNRTDLAGFPEGGFVPGECVDIYDAVDLYTAEGAYASFEEREKGRIREGCLADLAVLDRDLFSVPSGEIRTVRTVATYLGGKLVHNRMDG